MQCVLSRSCRESASLLRKMILLRGHAFILPLDGPGANTRLRGSRPAELTQGQGHDDTVHDTRRGKRLGGPARNKTGGWRAVGECRAIRLQFVQDRNARGPSWQLQTSTIAERNAVARPPRLSSTSTFAAIIRGRENVRWCQLLFLSQGGLGENG